jgi:hypothetical protein
MTLVSLGIVANILAIMAPWFPWVIRWVSLLFIGFALAFWIYVGLRFLSHLSSATPRRLPADFHAAGMPCREFPTSFKAPEGLRSRLLAVEQCSLILLIADRLGTFGWSKTMVWRFVRSQKPLSPVGTLTGTYYALEALEAYGYRQTKPARALLANLALVFTADGVVVQSVKPNSAGAPEAVPENLRHSAGFFLLRSRLAEKVSRADIVLAARLGAKLDEKLKIIRLEGGESHRDIMGSAFATAALLAGLEWLPPSPLDGETATQAAAMLKALIELPQLSTLGHPSWGVEPGVSAAVGKATAQWVVAWLLASMIGWSGISSETREIGARRLLELVEENINAIPDVEKLLPHSFALGAHQAPHAESMLATATACHVVTLVQPFLRGSDAEARCGYAIGNLLTRIGHRGVDYVNLSSVEDPWEGYLAWASVLMALRPFLYRTTEVHAASSKLAAAEAKIQRLESRPDSQSGDEPWTQTALNTASRLDALLKEAGVAPGRNRLYQPLWE